VPSFIRACPILGKTADLPSDACRDSQDLSILGLAIGAHANYLVTGDDDLQVLKTIQGIPILSPRQFYEKLHGD
jgi:predicted nucleic acid-binding protein